MTILKVKYVFNEGSLFDILCFCLITYIIKVCLFVIDKSFFLFYRTRSPYKAKKSHTRL